MIKKPVKLVIELSYSQAVALSYQLKDQISKVTNYDKDEVSAFKKWKREQEKKDNGGN